MSPRQKCDELTRNAEAILEELSRLKKSENEVCASFRSEIKIIYENRDFTVSASNATDLFGVRSIVDGRPGFLTTNSVNPSSLREIASEVQAIASASPANPANIVAEGGDTPLAMQCDEKLLSMGAEDAARYAQKVIAEARRDDRISIDRAEFSVEWSCRVLLNSKGVRRSAAQALAGWYVMGMARTADQVTSFDYDGASTAHAQEIDGEIETSVKRFRDSVIGSLDPVHGKSYKGIVILHPRAVMDLIASAVLSNCNARSHQDNLSPWKGKLGERVASPALRVYEDPLDLGRPEGWSTFDREGTATSRHDLIESGNLRFLGHNCFTAKRENCAPTGNASGGARSIPGVGFSNIGVVLEEGRGSDVLEEQELFRRNTGALLLNRFSGNSDSVSGRFSGVAKNSRLIADGENRAVQEIMISGNLFEVLDRICAGGNTPHRLAGGSLAPYIAVDGISVTAG